MSVQLPQQPATTNSMEIMPAFFAERLYPSDELAQMNTAQLMTIGGVEAVGKNRDELLEVTAQKNQNLPSTVLAQMNTQQLLALSGAEAVGNNREELLELARQKQASRLGAYITALAKPAEVTARVVTSYPKLTVEGQVPLPIQASNEMLGKNLKALIKSIDAANYTPSRTEVVPATQAPNIISTPNVPPPISVERLAPAQLPPSVYMPSTILFPQEFERQRRSPNVLSNRFRDALSRSIDKIIPSGRTLGKIGAGLALFATAYTFLPGIRFDSEERENKGKASSGAIAEAPATAPIDSAPTETTIEVVTTTEAPAPETTAAPTTTVEATTTTEAPKTIMEQLLSGEMAPEQVAAVKYAEIDIPSLCLDGISAYGSNRRSSNDVAVLNYFVEQGLLSTQDSDALAKGVASEVTLAKFYKLFDKIYLVEQTDAPQEACATAAPMDNPKYPARWDRTLQDESIPGLETTPVKNIEPVVDIDTQGALPGQVGNMIVTGHRTTDSAVFANLDQLKPGDTITVRTDDGKAYTYAVESNSPIDVDLINKDYYGYLNGYVSLTGSDKTATFMTCSGGTEDRIIVRAVLLEQA